ncbi:transcription elongation factor Spt5 [Candidatus Methanosphaera massiliense]|uniref:transcription elongation factor Spt5 n=1 Tax=Methanosphaera TaxID=2316 RepID=UPI0023804343|nr:transcription elongation factor Spt5 [Candidatus Methanosphaera massiliense]MDD6286181.1 transcription elongation factor Spt5 [Methanobacteriaceae archaeon]MDE4077654.1 transcription elongation factor Spt5 [Candidatus Methanosphaera massiliense]
MFYAMRVLIGQEKTVAALLAQSVKHEDTGISAILSPESMQGYIFVESDKALDMRHPALKVPNLRGLVEGDVDFDELKAFLNPEPAMANVSKGSIVELTSGPFKGEKAKVVRIDEAKEDVVLELIEAAVPIPVTVKGDQIRLIQREAE